MSKKKQRKAAVGQAVPATSSREKKVPGPAGMTTWLIILLLVLPVVYSRATMDALLTPRYIGLSLFLLVFIVYFLLIRLKGLSFPLPDLNKWVFMAGGIYALWMIVTMTTALNYREGYYEVGRHLLCLVYLGAVMITVIKEEGRLQQIFYTLVIVAIFHSLVGIMQHYESGFTNIPGSNSKPYGLMANRNLYGSAIVLLLPFVLYVLHRGSSLWKSLAAIALGLQVIAILLSQTRSAWVAALVVIVVAVSGVLIFSKINRRRWLIGAGSFAVVSGLLVFLVIAGDSEGTLAESVTQRTQSFTRGGTVDDAANRENVQERFRIWRKTIALIKDKPLTGAGPGNWKITIPEYGTDGLAWATGLYAPDRVHNVYLQVTAETGLPGALIYFAMWALIVVVAIRMIRRPRNEDQRVLIILMLAGLAGLASDSMFSFPAERYEHTVLFYAMAGIILGLYANNQVEVKKFSCKQPFAIGLLAICGLNLLLGLAKRNFEIHLQKGKELEKAGQYAEMVREIDKGKSSFVTLTPDVGMPLELKTAIALKELGQYDRAMHEVDKAWQYHPNSAAIWNTLGTIHTELGQFEKAVKAYERARQLAPQYDVVLKNLAINYYNLKRYKDTYNTLKTINVSTDAQLQQVKDYSRQMAGDSITDK